MSISFYYHNVQDLFIFLDRYKNQDIKTLTESDWQLMASSMKRNKPLQKITEIANLILMKSPDILLLTEVGGVESLENFNQYFLNKDYKVYHKDTNSDRGIDIGFLVKKSMAKHIHHQSFRNFKLRNNKRFSRDLQRLEVQGFCFYLTHLKSKLDIKKQDFEGRSQRQAEILGIQSILAQEKLPYFLCGDLNGIYSDLENEPEFKPLHDMGLKNLILKFHPEPITYHYFDIGENKHSMQLDYVLGTKSAEKELLRLDILAFNDTMGNLYPDPDNLQQKLALPSDHYPLFGEIKRS
jgi:hypothetical protein